MDKKWGYIDKTGKFVIEPQYAQAFMFSEGLAQVLTRGGTGFIDKTGKMVIAPQTWEVSNFDGGLAFVRQNGNSGYIDKTGKFIWKIKDE